MFGEGVIEPIDGVGGEKFVESMQIGGKERKERDSLEGGDFEMDE